MDRPPKSTGLPIVNDCSPLTKIFASTDPPGTSVPPDTPASFGSH